MNKLVPHRKTHASIHGWSQGRQKMRNSFSSGCGFDLCYNDDGKCCEFCKSGDKRDGEREPFSREHDAPDTVRYRGSALDGR